MQDAWLVEGRLMKAPMLLVLAGLSISAAQAAEPETQMLACKGTTKDDIPDAKPEPISTSIIIDFKAGIIEGDLAYGRMTITDVTNTSITFKGSDTGRKDYSYTIDGTIDRVTGATEAVQTSVLNERWTLTKRYSLQCKPTKRMF
jgi:hypothetical protein